MLARCARWNVSSHASPFCAQSRATGARALSHSVAGRARSRTLMPGRSLTRPCPGTGPQRVSVRERAASGPFATARAIITSPPVRVSPLQLTSTGWWMVLARCPGRETRRFAPRWTARAEALAGQCAVSTARCGRRPHSAGMFSARVLRLVPATAHSRLCGCASRYRDDAPTDCGLWRGSSLRLRCSCLRVWAFDCTATPNTADCPSAVA